MFGNCEQRFSLKFQGHFDYCPNETPLNKTLAAPVNLIARNPNQRQSFEKLHISGIISKPRDRVWQKTCGQTLFCKIDTMRGR